MNNGAGVAPHPAVLGEFNYLDAATSPSLHRNGEVYTRRDGDGSDHGWVGVNFDACKAPVNDARALPSGERRTLAENGFELVGAPLDDTSLDFLDHGAVVNRYYPQCAALVKDATGARVVGAFDHNVRSATGKKSQQRIEGGQQVQGPAHVVHGDYTLTSAPQRLHDLTQPPTGNDTLRDALGSGNTLLDAEDVEQALRSGRYGIINVWRSIAPEPVATRPLAMCDARTVSPQDLVVFEIQYADRTGENYFARHREQHDWYYYSSMTRSEALLLKQWDSAGRLASTDGAAGDGGGDACTFSFHSAFEDPTTPSDAPDRWSIEVRCAVLY